MFWHHHYSICSPNMNFPASCAILWWLLDEYHNSAHTQIWIRNFGHCQNLLPDVLIALALNWLPVSTLDYLTPSWLMTKEVWFLSVAATLGLTAPNHKTVSSVVLYFLCIFVAWLIHTAQGSLETSSLGQSYPSALKAHAYYSAINLAANLIGKVCKFVVYKSMDCRPGPADGSWEFKRLIFCLEFFAL